MVAGTVEAFAAGGATGLVYQLLLQLTVDSIPGSSDYRPPPARRLQRFLSSPVCRLSFLGAAIVAGIQARMSCCQRWPEPAHFVPGRHVVFARPNLAELG